MKIPFVITAIMSATVLSITMPAAAQTHQHEQPEGQQMDAEGMTNHQMKGGMMMGQTPMACPMMDQFKGEPRTEERLAIIKTELKINSDQEVVWNDYAEAVRVSHQGMADHMSKMHQKMMKKHNTMETAEPIPAPKALQSRIEMMEGMLANLKSIKRATSELYGKLDQSQKVTADQLLGMSCGMMRM